MGTGCHGQGAAPGGHHSLWPQAGHGSGTSKHSVGASAESCSLGEAAVLTRSAQQM